MQKILIVFLILAVSGWCFADSTIPDRTATTTAADADEIPIYDASATSGRAITLANFWTWIWTSITSNDGTGSGLDADTLDGVEAAAFLTDAGTDNIDDTHINWGDGAGQVGHADVTALYGSGSCSGYLKSDGTCDTPGGTGDITSVGDCASGDCTAGIADNNVVQIDDADAADDDFAKFTASGLEGRSASEMRTDLGLATTDTPTFAGVTITASDNPSWVLDENDDADIYGVNDDVGEQYEISTDSTPSSNNIIAFDISDGDIHPIQGASLILTDNNTVSLDATADGMDDGEYNGITIEGMAHGETVGALKCVFLASDGKFDIADADAAGEFPALGLTVNGGDDTDAAIILTRGIVRDEDWTGLTVGGAVYLGDDGTGQITQTAPSTSGDCVQIVGWALSDSEIYFDFSRPYLEVE